MTRAARQAKGLLLKAEIPAPPFHYEKATSLLFSETKIS